MSGSKLDFVGFGALNVDVFYLLRPGSTVDQVLPELRPGGEITGTQSQRQQALKAAHKHATFAGRSGGGQAANTTVALARMGFRCGFLGKVGDDEMGDFLMESLENVDQARLKRGGHSGTCLCILDQNGERTNVVFPGCNDTISLDDSDLEYVSGSKALHVTSFCDKRILESQTWLLHRAHMDSMITTFDPGEIYSRLGVESLRNTLKSTSVLFVTADELRLMTGKEPRKAAKDIMEYGTDVVVCKNAENGSEIISKATRIAVPIAPVDKVLDKTGAGDVYAAGFIAGLLLELPLEVCGKLASEAAARSISAYGRDKYPDREFLQDFLKLAR